MMKRLLYTIVIPAVAGLMLVACFGDDDEDSSDGSSDTPTATTQQSSSQQPATTTGVAAALNAQTSANLTELVAEVQPWVVAVVRGQGEGSGVIWDDQGHIVTNNHVVEGASSLQVVLADGQELSATLIAGDPITDIAVLQVDRTDLPAANFTEQLPEVGSFVLAIGNPLGFESSVTFGIVSGLHRSIPSGGTNPALVDLVQTDAAISPGNSGGALVNLEGEVIGINVAFIPPSAQAVSLGFAIPSSTVLDVVPQLLEDGNVEHAFLGVEPRPLSPQIVNQLGLDVSEGVLVFGLSSGGAAEEAGLQRGDVIVELDGEEIASVEDLYAALRDFAPGDEVEISVVRNGSEEQIQATLQDRPASS